MRLLILLCFFICALGQYQPNWESLDARPTPDWYLDAKFGIFIHWGVYSVPSYGPPGVYAEWYGWYMNIPNDPTQLFHNKTYGPGFLYTEFADSFKAELWDPEAWADLFVRAGAQYIVPTSKHHEGFNLWPSAQSWNWNAADIGPKRDILGELYAALRSRNLHPAAYYSLYEWYNPLYTGSDPTLYVEQVMLPQLYDLVKTYQPDVLWTDGEWEHNSTFWQATEFLAWLFNESPNKENVVINDRWGSDTRRVHGGFYTAEYNTSAMWLNHAWEENSAIDVFSYGLNRMTDADHYYSGQYLVYLLIRTVSTGGNLLLDIGPHADGSIPPIMQERLLQIGGWLDVNGEAIYGSRAWRVQRDVIFPSSTYYSYVNQTTTVYGICNEWVSSGCNSTTVKLMGQTNTSSACESLCDNDQTCLSYTWYDATNAGLALACFIRIGYDDTWSPMYQSGAVSAQKAHWIIDYTFQNPNVTADPAVYAIIHPWPPAQIVLPSPATTSSATTITLLGYGNIQYKSVTGVAGITLTIPTISPGTEPCNYAFTFKMQGVK